MPNRTKKILTTALVGLVIGWSIFPFGQLNFARAQATCDPDALRPVWYGLRNANVRNAQACLIELGYDIPAGPTGYYGPQTRAAVRAYYKDNLNMDWSRSLGPKGIAKMKELLAQKTAPSPADQTQQLIQALQQLAQQNPQLAAIVQMLVALLQPTATPTAPTATPTVPTVGLNVSLASDNPAGGTLPKGASNVPVLKITFTGQGTVNSISVKRTGIGATSDFANVYLYDGATRLTTGRTINSQTHIVSFTGLNVQVNGSKTLTVSVDVSSSAVTGNQHVFQVVSASDIVASETVSGNFPIVSNSFTIGGQTVGSLTIQKSGSVDNPKVGQQQAKLTEFKITAGSAEDINIQRISLFYSGSLSRSYLSNFVLKQAGNSVASASAINEKDLLVLVFDNPFTLEKGAVRTFELYGDISASAKPGETIKFYVDDSSDVYAVGAQYGYGVSVDRNGFDSDSADHHSLTLQGGQITITFNGPPAGDIALRGQDVVLLDFTISSQNNIEIRRMSFSVSTTGLTSGEGFNDFKVRNAATGQVVTNSVDVTTSTTVTFTDPIYISAGQSIQFQVTADVDPDNDNGDTIQVALAAFGSSDIKNLDNNQYVNTSDIVPNGVTGNTMTVKAPSLEVALAGQPSSRTITPGAQNVELLGVTFRAVADDIKITSLTFDGSNSSSSVDADLQALALYDGATRVSDKESIDSTTKQVTFSNLSITIPEGQSKVLVLKADQLSNSANNGSVYYFTLSASGVTAVDSEGNTLTLSFSEVNSGGTVKMTVGSPSLTFTKVTVTNVSDAGIVPANSEVTLATYDVYAQNADIVVKKFAVGVNNNGNAATTTALAEEVSEIRVYLDGSLVLSGTPDAAGSYAGIARFENLDGLFTLPANQTKRLTVKAVLNDINTQTNAQSGSTIYAYLPATTTAEFQATAGTQTLTDAVGLGSASVGAQKVVYKGYPSVTKIAEGVDGAQLVAGEQAIAKFQVEAVNSDVSVKKLTFNIALSNATLTANSLTIYRDGSQLTTATATVADTGGTAVIELQNEDLVSVGSPATYEVRVTVAQVGTGAASLVTTFVTDTSLITPTTYANASSSKIVWSDRSGQPHSESSSDWVNSKYVKDLTSSWTRSKSQ